MAMSSLANVKRDCDWPLFLQHVMKESVFLWGNPLLLGLKGQPNGSQHVWEELTLTTMAPGSIPHMQFRLKDRAKNRDNPRIARDLLVEETWIDIARGHRNYTVGMALGSYV